MSATPAPLALALPPLSPEARLLLLSAGGAENDAAVGALLDGPIDWTLLLQLGVAEGAHPALGKRIRSARGGMPAEAPELWSAVERLAGFRMAYLRRRMEQAMQLLTQAGISMVVLKGAAMALTAHRSFQERPMSDIDLLVRPADADRAIRLLKEGGWAQNARDDAQAQRFAGKHHLAPLMDVGAPQLEIGVELHTELFSPLRNPFRLTATEVWRSAAQVEGKPAGVLVPDPYHALLHCCLHYSWSHTLRKGTWRTLRDIAAVCRNGNLDWSRFSAMAETAGGSSCCYWSLRMARALAGVPVPEAALRELGAPGPAGLLRSLEHHFAREALEAERRCPSSRLRKALWVAAVRPGASGHRGKRPWTRVAGDEGDDTGGGRERIRPGDARRLGEWVGYLGYVLRAGFPSRQPSSPARILPPASARG